MKSHAFEHLPQWRIKELAAEFSDDEIRASLREDEDNLPFIFEFPDGRTLVMYWNAFNGEMAVADDDSVRAYAQAEYLRRHGYPCFHSDDEIEAYSVKHGWPRKNRDGTTKS